MSTNGQVFHTKLNRDPVYASLAARDSDAERASTQLKNMILRQFDHFEIRHGLKQGEGQVLLLDIGVRL